jgi:hypothetical protein
MGHITRLRRKSATPIARSISKAAKKAIDLREIDVNDIPGQGTITIAVVERYLQALEVSVSQTQKPIIHDESESESETQGQEGNHGFEGKEDGKEKE